MNRLIVSGCVALAVVAAFAVWLSGVQAGPKAAGPDPDAALVVTMVTPTRNQHTLPDLSDPGLNNVITVRFSTFVDPRDVVDASTVPNGLGRKCDFHDQRLAPVRVSVSVRRNFLTLDPFSVTRPVLPPGRYTLTLKPTIRSLRGRMLNDGRGAFTTTFYVGSGTAFAPVLRRVSPNAGRTGVGLHRAIVATFDEPIAPVSAAWGVRLEDRSTSPATPIFARIRVSRRGLDVVVTPEAVAGYPPRTELTLVLPGRGTSTDPSARLLTAEVGHEFTRDLGPSWTIDPTVPTLFHSKSGDFDEVTGEFTTTFRTRGAAARR
jgi:hypothetical protein